MKIGFIIKKIAKHVALGMVGTGFVLVGQLGQYGISTKDARMHTISLWNEQHPNNESVSQLFVHECLTSKKVDSFELKKQISGDTKPIDVYDCGNNVGASDLVKAIRKTDQSMHSLAWPLSVFVN